MMHEQTDDTFADARDGDRDDDNGERPDGAAPRRRRRSRSSGGRSGESRSGNGTDDARIAGRRPGRARTASRADDSTANGSGADDNQSAPHEAPSVEASRPSGRSATTRSAPTRAAAARSSDASGPVGVEDVVAALADMRETVERFARRERVGVFVDVPNLLYGAERVEEQVDMGRLLTHLTRGRDLMRATAYAPVSDNPAEPVERQKFVAPFVPHGYRIVTKPLKRFQDGSIKGNFDVEMAVDIVTMSDRLDVISIVSGDADFAKAVEYVQQKGVRVEVIAFAGSSSIEMRALADEFIEVGAILEDLRPRRR